MIGILCVVALLAVAVVLLVAVDRIGASRL
jgi:hypothetical protein